MLIVTSTYSDKLFIYDPANGFLLKRVPIKSDYCVLQKNGVQLNDDNILNIQTEVNKKMLLPRISNIFYQKQKKRFIVIIQNEIDSKENMQNRYFSILVYNNKFEKISEDYFNDLIYDSYSAILIENDIYMHFKTNLKTVKKYDKIKLENN